MRILMVTDYYHPYVGGVEQHVRSLSTELVARGHEVAVATLWSEGLEANEFDAGVRVFRIRASTQRLPALFRNRARMGAPSMPDPEALNALRGIVRD